MFASRPSIDSFLWPPNPFRPPTSALEVRTLTRLVAFDCSDNRTEGYKLVFNRFCAHAPFPSLTLTSFRPRTPSSFSFQMSSETSSPRSLTPLQPLQSDSLDNVQKTPFSLLYDGRLPFRVRPRQMILLFAAAITTLVLFSQRSLFLESSLDNRPPVSSPFAAVQTTEPVVFALIMYSENSAREGAILLKVSARLELMSRLGNRTHHIVRHNVY